MEYIINEPGSSTINIPTSINIGDKMVFNTTGTGATGTYFQLQVPVSGLYECILWGANGSIGNVFTYTSNLPTGGFGCGVRGNLKLAKESTLTLVVGQKGTHIPAVVPVKDGSSGASGGCSALFIKRPMGKYCIDEEAHTLLALAGSGGGAGDYGMSYPTRTNGQNASSIIHSYVDSVFNTVAGICRGSFEGSTYSRSEDLAIGGYGGGHATDDFPTNGVGYTVVNRSGTNYLYGSGAWLGLNTDPIRNGEGQITLKLLEIYSTNVVVEEGGPVNDCSGGGGGGGGVTPAQVDAKINAHATNPVTHRNLIIDAEQVSNP